MNKVLHLVYSSAISNMCDANSSFDGGVLKIAYAGQNRNGSFISKETFENCIATAFNCPIVCHYEREEDSIGGHDADVVKDSNNNYKIINLTHPVGVIPESAEYHWEEITEEDGTIHEYLCMDALLWKRQEAYEKIKEDGIVSESMEITVKDGYLDKETGLFVITDFEFTAFCLLGEGITPCFEQASIETFSYSDIKAEIVEMMDDLKASFSLTVSHNETDINVDNFAEGGNEKLDEKIELISNYGLTVEGLDFSIEDYSLEEIESKLKELTCSVEEQPEEQIEEQSEQAEEFSADLTEEAVEEVAPVEQAEENFELSRNMRAEFEQALKAVTMLKPWGEEMKYWFEDYDCDKAELYCRDVEDWLMYKFSYSMSGDEIVIDFDSKKRVKIAYVDFAEGEEPMMSAMFGYFEDKYQSVITPLVEFKENTEAAAALAKEKAEQEEVFAKFENDLNGIEAFQELKQNCSGVSAEELEDKCFALKGRYGKFSLEPKAPKLPIPQSGIADAENEPYHGIFQRFGFSVNK